MNVQSQASRGVLYISSSSAINRFLALALLTLKVGVINSFSTVKVKSMTCSFLILSSPLNWNSFAFAVISSKTYLTKSGRLIIVFVSVL